MSALPIGTVRLHLAANSRHRPHQPRYHYLPATPVASHDYIRLARTSAKASRNGRCSSEASPAPAEGLGIFGSSPRPGTAKKGPAMRRLRPQLPPGAVVRPVRPRAAGGPGCSTASGVGPELHQRFEMPLRAPKTNEVQGLDVDSRPWNTVRAPRATALAHLRKRTTPLGALPPLRRPPTPQLQAVRRISKALAADNRMMISKRMACKRMVLGSMVKFRCTAS